MWHRLASALVAVWGAVTLVFVITRFIGDPSALLLPIGASAAQIDALRAQLGLDLPLWEQYLHYLGQAFEGDFGQSFISGKPALSQVLERLPATLLLGGSALVFGVLSGGLAAIALATRGDRLTRFILQPLVLLAQATPGFWLGMLLVMLFAVNLGWLPSGGYGKASHLALPALTLGAFIAASVARFLQASLLEALHGEHVRTALAAGLPWSHVFRWHVLRNGLVPVVTFLGIVAGELLGGAVVVETVFSWPGSGRLLVQSINSQDFPVIQAAVLVAAVLFVAINLLVDLLNQWLDPRIAHGGRR
ncbi:ABC transporter permease [Pseudomonas huaxiensis]|uniref:ABC transporter permease n=1 Tax=Pseudomonas huaxiensis TaxID=2213017 RepID=UPI000DA67376|nr:ABC transporter permease [Pseudomonas huaxiensis]